MTDKTFDLIKLQTVWYSDVILEIPFYKKTYYERNLDEKKRLIAKG